MNLFRRELDPSCEEQLEQLKRRIRELEFKIEQNPAKFDPQREVITIAGLDYSLHLFEALGGKPGPFLPIGAVFELVDRQGGSIIIRPILNEIDLRRAVKMLEAREAQRAADFEKSLKNPGDFLHE